MFLIPCYLQPITSGNIDPLVLASLPPSMQLDLLVQVNKMLQILAISFHENSWFLITDLGLTIFLMHLSLVL